MSISGVTISSGSERLYRESDIASACTVVSQGELNISYGLAIDTTVLSGGYIYVYSGQTSNTTIFSGGVESAAPGSITQNTVISSGGIQEIIDTSIAKGTIVYEKGNQYLRSLYGHPASAIDTVLSGGNQILLRGGNACNTTISSGGSQLLSGLSSIYTSNTIISAGGSQIIQGNNQSSIVNGTHINSGGYLYIKGSTYTDIVNLDISAGGILVDSGLTTLTVNKAGMLSGVWYSNNALRIQTSMSANNFVMSGGYQYVYSGGETTKAKLTLGAEQFVLEGAKTKGTILVESGYQTVSSGAQAYDTIVSNQGSQTVLMGGQTEGTVVNSGGIQIVSNGFADGTIVKSGGIINLTRESLTSASDLSVSAGGSVQNGSNTILTVNKKGALKKIGFKSMNLHVGNGMTASRFTMKDTTMYVSSGGKTTLATIEGAYQVVLQNGTTVSTILNTSAKQIISGGKASNTIVNTGASQIVDIAGSAVNTKVKKGGAQVLQNGGKSFATVFSGGQQIVGQDGVAQSGTIISDGGYQYIQNGGKGSAATLRPGGIQVVENGGIASGTVVSSGGLIALQNAMSGSNTAIAKDITVKVGGKVGAYIEGEATEQFTVGIGGTLSKITYSNGAVQVHSGMNFKKVSIANGGVVNVASNGTTNSITLLAGSVQNVLKNGKTVKTTASGLGAEQHVSDGGVASNTLLTDNGTQIVHQKGTAKKTDVKADGLLQVSSGGIAVSAIIRKDGMLLVTSGGTIQAPTLMSGGSLSLQSGAIMSDCVLGGAGTVNLANAINLRGSNSFSKTIFENGNDITVAKNGKLYLNGGVAMENIALNASSATVTLTGKNNTIGSLKGNAKTNIVYDLKNVAARGTPTLLEVSTRSKSVGKYAVLTTKAQAIGTYELSTNIDFTKGTAITLKQGSTKLGTAKVNSKSLSIYGVKYTVKMDEDYLTTVQMSLVEGKIYKGSSAKKTLAGTASTSDIFYGGTGNETINGENGRDVVIYDKNTWGKDIIANTSGTITLLFKDITAKQISQKTSGKDLIITKKSDTKQTITVRNYSEETHNIVFASSMTAFTKYLKATSPTTKQTQTAKNEVWKKAGLASA